MLVSGRVLRCVDGNGRVVPHQLPDISGDSDGDIGVYDAILEAERQQQQRRRRFEICADRFDMLAMRRRPDRIGRGQPPSRPAKNVCHQSTLVAGTIAAIGFCQKLRAIEAASRFELQ